MKPGWRKVRQGRLWHIEGPVGSTNPFGNGKDCLLHWRRSKANGEALEKVAFEKGSNTAQPLILRRPRQFVNHQAPLTPMTCAKIDSMTQTQARQRRCGQLQRL